MQVTRDRIATFIKALNFPTIQILKSSLEDFLTDYCSQIGATYLHITLFMKAVALNNFLIPQDPKQFISRTSERCQSRGSDVSLKIWTGIGR